MHRHFQCNCGQAAVISVAQEKWFSIHRFIYSASTWLDSKVTCHIDMVEAKIEGLVPNWVLWAILGLSYAANSVTK
jgi:hypothetical protein